MLKLFQSIRESYGLEEEDISNFKASTIQIISTLSSKLVRYATKEGLIIVLKRFAGRIAVQKFSKYIPIFGQTIAAGIGYALTSNIGSDYLEDCHELAKTILISELKQS